jgi:hypothetical protein
MTERTVEKEANAFESAKLKARLKQVAHDAMLNTTSHGIPNLCRADKLYIKIVWIVLFLLSSSYCTYLIVLSIQNYIEFNVVTQIKTINQVPSPFPSVTICNANSYLTQSSLEYVQKVLRDNNIKDILESGEFNNSYIKMIMTRYFIGTNTILLNEREKRNLSVPFGEMLISCTFGLAPCSENDFEWSFDTLYGNCFT